MALEFGSITYDPLPIEEIERRVQGRFPDLACDVHRGELTFFVAPDRLLEVLAFCRDDEELDLDLLADLSGVHWPGGRHFMEPQISTTGWPAYRLTDEVGRIEVLYLLRSVQRGHVLRFIVAVDDVDPRIPSVVDLYPTADFLEREAYDFFGVRFDGHPNLVRIFMPDDWEGYPQRKDYPLGGVDTPYHGAFIPPPDDRVWARDVPGAQEVDPGVSVATREPHPGTVPPAPGGARVGQQSADPEAVEAAAEEQREEDDGGDS